MFNLYRTTSGTIMRHDVTFGDVSKLRVSKSMLQEINEYHLDAPVKDLHQFMVKYVPANMPVSTSNLDGTVKVNLRAINRLIDILRTVNPKAFDLTAWYGNSYQVASIMGREVMNVYKKDNIDRKIIVASCGTTACACGYAGLDVWFRKQGFRFGTPGNNWRDSMNTNILFKSPHSDVIYEGFEAVQEFFGLTSIQALHLFYNEPGYRTVDHVIDRLIKFSSTIKQLSILAARRNNAARNQF